MDHPITTRVPRKLALEIKREAKARKLKMYVVFEEALRLWLAAKKAA